MTEHTQKSHAKSRSRGFEIALLGFCVVIVILATVFLINNRPPNITVPRQKMPKVNGWDDFVKAAEIIEHAKRPVRWPPNAAQETWDAKSYVLSVRESAPALRLIRRGLTKPYLGPNLLSNYDKTLYSHYVAFRKAAWMLKGEAAYYEQTGKAGKAADSRLDCMEFGVTLPRGGDIIPALLGCAIQGMGDRRFGPMLPKLNLAELAHVATRLEIIRNKRPVYSDIVLNEGSHYTAAIAREFRAPDHVKRMLNPDFWYMDDEPGRVRLLWDKTRLAFANKTAMIRKNEAYYKAVAVEQRGHYTGTSKVPVPDNGRSEFLDTVVVARISYVRPEAMLALIQTEVALRRYRFDHNRYPGKLSQLVPVYLKSVPIDPFGLGKRLRYKTLGGGKDFLLYSLGPNLRDDGGIVVGRWQGSDTLGDLLLKK